MEQHDEIDEYVPVCSPSCDARRGAYKRPYDPRLQTKAELLDELDTAHSAAQEAWNRLERIPEWVQWLCNRF